MASKEQILELLGCGLSNEVVASSIGCDPSYISQLMADEAFNAEVVARRAKTLQANTTRDRHIDKIEDALLDKLEQAVNFVHKPLDIARLFSVVNTAKRRGVEARESVTINQQVVNLTLPKTAATEFVVTEKGEVVEAGGQTLVTMSAKTLLNKLAKETGDANKYAKVAALIPGGTT